MECSSNLLSNDIISPYSYYSNETQPHKFDESLFPLMTTFSLDFLQRTSTAESQPITLEKVIIEKTIENTPQNIKIQQNEKSIYAKSPKPQ